ncbi:hypothetical protein [Aeromonas veronii]|uniref:hypothetical protein n=1 Tax=Aeromonas veronii TaxID=654 RepID=UPI0035B91481
MADNLTWLARNAHLWPEIAPGRAFAAAFTVEGSVKWLEYPPVDWDSCYQKHEWLARRAELQNKPSFADHPDAKCFFQHESGRWFKNVESSDMSVDGIGWRNNQPSRRSDCGWVDIGLGEVLGDWRDTLDRRPVDLSEPAGGVKELGADGAEEINAMAQRLLVALKSEPRSFDTGALAEMVELADAEIVKRDAKVCGGEGYLNNHWFERGELPPVGEFVDVEGEDLVYGDGELNCEVIAHVEDTAVIRMSYGLWCFQKHVLSPSRTERDKAIDDMRQHFPYPGSLDTIGLAYAAALYNAGYRKQISPAK